MSTSIQTSFYSILISSFQSLPSSVILNSRSAFKAWLFRFPRLSGAKRFRFLRKPSFAGKFFCTVFWNQAMESAQNRPPGPRRAGSSVAENIGIRSGLPDEPYRNSLSSKRNTRAVHLRLPYCNRIFPRQTDSQRKRFFRRPRGKTQNPACQGIIRIFPEMPDMRR